MYLIPTYGLCILVGSLLGRLSAEGIIPLWLAVVLAAAFGWLFTGYMISAFGG